MQDVLARGVLAVGQPHDVAPGVLPLLIIIIVILLAYVIVDSYNLLIQERTCPNQGNGTGIGRGQGKVLTQSYYLLITVVIIICFLIPVLYILMTRNIKRHLEDKMKLIAEIVDKNEIEKKIGLWLSNQLTHYKNKTGGMKDNERYNKWTEFLEEFKEYFDTNDSISTTSSLEEVEEEIIESLQEQISKTMDMFKRFKKY